MMRGNFLYCMGVVAACGLGFALGQSGVLDTTVRVKTDRFASGLVPETIVFRAAKDQARIEPFACPPGTREVWEARGDIGCEARK